MAAGIAASVLGFSFAATRLAPLSTLPSRLDAFALSLLPLAITLTVSIGRLAAHRFHTPEDIGGSGLTGGTDRARLLQAMLQNTLEQLALAVPVYAAWVLLSPAQLAGLCVAAALLFLVGRVLFFAGYARGAPSRAFGFALSFYPTVALLIGALAVAVRRFVL
jgi:uncharacterized MAPEG superfamily protein